MTYRLWLLMSVFNREWWWWSLCHFQFLVSSCLKYRTLLNKVLFMTGSFDWSLQYIISKWKQRNEKNVQVFRANPSLLHQRQAPADRGRDAEAQMCSRGQNYSSIQYWDAQQHSGLIVFTATWWLAQHIAQHVFNMFEVQRTGAHTQQSCGVKIFPQLAYNYGDFSMLSKYEQLKSRYYLWSLYYLTQKKLHIIH